MKVKAEELQASTGTWWRLSIERLAYAAAALVPGSRAQGLSLGDRACLALALGATALTTDRAWRVGVAIEVIR